MKYLMTIFTLGILSMGGAATADSGNAGADNQGKMMAMMDHATPMPGLMRVFSKHADELKLNEEESAALSQVRDKYQGEAQGMVKEIIAGEKAVYQAAMDDKTVEEITKTAQNVMEKRLSLIDTKGRCRDDMRKALSDDGWEKVLAVYKANYE